MSSSQFRVLIVGNDDLLTVGIEALVREQSFLLMVSEPSGLEEAYTKACALSPDLVIIVCANELLDECAALCRRIRIRCHDTRVVVISRGTSPLIALRFLSSGAVGYFADTLSKGQLPRHLLRAALGETVVRGVGSMSTWDEPDAPDSGRVGGVTRPKDVSTSEWNVLRLLIMGHSNKEIANALSLSLNTVKWHLSKVYQKLGVKCRSQAILVLFDKELAD